MRRAAVRLARIFAGLALALMCVVAVALTALQLPATRDVLRAPLARLVSDAIPGELRIGALDELSTLRIVARDVRLLDTRGREVVRIGRLVAHPRLGRLARGVLELARLRADDVHVRVFFEESGSISLVDSVYQPSESAGDADDGGGLEIVLRRIVVARGRVDVDVGHGEPLVLRGVALRGQVRSAETTRVVVERLDFDAERGGVALLGTRRAHAAYRTDPGAGSNVGIALRGLEDRIRLEARLRNPPSAEASLAESSVRARLALDPITPRVLDVIGLDDLARDAPPRIRAEFELGGTFRDARLVGHVTARDETLRLTADYHAGRESTADFCSPGMRLGSFWTSLPDSRVGGCVRVTSGDFTKPDFSLAVSVANATLDGKPLPDLALGTTVHTGAESLALESFALPGLEGANRDAVALEGRVGFDGTAHVVLATHGFVLGREPSLAAWFGPLGGAVRSRTTIDLEATGTADGPLRVTAHSHMTIDGLRAGDVRARRLDLTADATGPLDSPRGSVHLDASGLRSGELAVRSVALDARASIDSADLTLDARLPTNRRFTLIAKSAKRGEHWTSGAHGILGTIEEPFRFELERLDYAPRSGAIVIGRFQVHHGESRVVVHGAVTGGSRLGLAFVIEDFDIADVVRATGSRRRDLVGTLTGRGTIGGTTSVPTLDAELELADGGAIGVRDVGASVALRYGTTSADVSLDLVSPSAGAVALEASASWPRPMAPARVVELADVDMRLVVQDLSLSVLDRAQSVPVGVAGELDATFVAVGPLAAPVITLRASGASLTFPGVSTGSEGLEAALVARFDPTTLTLELDTADERGPLLDVRVEASVSSRALLEGAPALGEIPFRAAFDLPERAVATLPLVLGGLADYPLRVELHAAVENVPGEPLGAEVTGSLHGTPVARADEDGARAERCGGVADLAVALDAKLERGETRAELAFTDHLRPAASLTLVAKTPVDAWLRGARDAPPFSIDLTGALVQIETSSLPMACAYARGPLDGTITASRLGTPDARASLHIDGPAILFADDAPVRITAEASVVEGEANASIVLLGAAGSRGEVRATVPFSFGEAGMAPELLAGELALRGTFENLSLEPFTAFTPFVPRRAGTLDGQVEVGGTMRVPAPRGELRLADASLLMPGLDQRLSDVQAHVSLTPERIVIHELRARDVRGRVSLEGEASFAASAPMSLTLEIRSRDFPARQAGIAIAEVTSHARVRLVRERDALRGSLVFEELSVKMPDISRGSVQALEENPDIVYLDTPPERWEPPSPAVRAAAEAADAPRSVANAANPGDDPGAGVVVTGADDMAPDSARVTPTVVDDTPFVPTYFDVDLRRPFWIRRTDFGVQLTAELEVAVLEIEMRLSGEVRVVRGFIELMGTSFEIREGTIRFTGGAAIDPVIDVLAIARSGRENEVHVHITGPLTTMVLRFSDANDREMTAGLAVQCITTGSCSEFGQLAGGGRGGDDGRAATADATSALASMTVGLLTTAARHGIGDAVPRIGISSGSRLEEVTVRAGFEANRLIPRFLRNLVTSLYIEGFVSTDPDEADREPVQSDNTRAVGGVLIELRHPRRFVTRGRYEPPNTWSLDVTWQR